jgi:AcrR family transcriptional regulator
MMAITPRAALKREEQREQLVQAAELRIAAHGAASLRARDLAQDVGVALGAIYNLVADLDELVLLVAGRTLTRLDQALARALETTRNLSPAARLKAVARGYLGFARTDTRLWRSVFDDGPSGEGKIPQSIVEQQARMFGHVLSPLAELTPDWNPQERQLFAHTLFTAAHGVVALSLEQRLAAVPPAAIEGQLDLLVDTICRGLEGFPARR